MASRWRIPAKFEFVEFGRVGTLQDRNTLHSTRHAPGEIRFKTDQIIEAIRPLRTAKGRGHAPARGKTIRALPDSWPKSQIPGGTGDKSDTSSILARKVTADKAEDFTVFLHLLDMRFSRKIPARSTVATTRGRTAVEFRQRQRPA